MADAPDVDFNRTLITVSCVQSFDYINQCETPFESNIIQLE